MSFRLAAYAVWVADGRLLLAHCRSTHWMLPGGGGEHGEDPFDAVIREVAEETGCDAVVERLLGVDSRVVPADVARAGVEHQNIGVFYRVRVTGGGLRPESGGDTAGSAGDTAGWGGGTAGSVWTPVPEVVDLRRSSLVDVGLAPARGLPVTGHVAPVPVGGLVQYRGRWSTPWRAGAAAPEWVAWPEWAAWPAQP